MTKDETILDVLLEGAKNDEAIMKTLIIILDDLKEIKAGIKFLNFKQ